MTILLILLAIGILWYSWGACTTYCDRKRLEEAEKRRAHFEDQYFTFLERSLRGAQAELVRTVRDRYPLIPFDPADPAHLRAEFPQLNDVVTTERMHRVWIRRTLRRTTEGIIKRYEEFTPTFDTSRPVHRDLVPDDFWVFERRNRRTSNGQSPQDWSHRRILVHDRDEGRCVRCGQEVAIYECHIHHVIRRARGGTHALENLVTLCASCHSLMPGHDRMLSRHNLEIRSIVATNMTQLVLSAVKDLPPFYAENQMRSEPNSQVKDNGKTILHAGNPNNDTQEESDHPWRTANYLKEATVKYSEETIGSFADGLFARSTEMVAVVLACSFAFPILVLLITAAAAVTPPTGSDHTSTSYKWGRNAEPASPIRDC